jgi:hypothetical protein
MRSTSSVAVLERFKLSDFKFRRESFQLEPGRTSVCPTLWCWLLHLPSATFSYLQLPSASAPFSSLHQLQLLQVPSAFSLSSFNSLSSVVLAPSSPSSYLQLPSATFSYLQLPSATLSSFFSSKVLVPSAPFSSLQLQLNSAPFISFSSFRYLQPSASAPSALWCWLLHLPSATFSSLQLPSATFSYLQLVLSAPFSSLLSFSSFSSVSSHQLPSSPFSYLQLHSG